MDRRLLARNEWRNTTNTFDGVRVTVGRQEAPWQVDVLALKPVRRLLSGFDHTDDSQWLVGAVGDWRRWSRIVTMQPYYLRLTREATSATLVERDVHTVGVRSHGLAGRSGWDWDVDAAQQFGKDGSRDHRASAIVVEDRLHDAPRVEATVERGVSSARPATRTRLTPGCNASSGCSASPARSRPATTSSGRTCAAPKLRVELTPTARLRIDAGVSSYWLDSPTDRWNAAGLRDPSGRSGTAIGVEYDVTPADADLAAPGPQRRVRALHAGRLRAQDERQGRRLALSLRGADRQRVSLIRVARAAT